MKKLFVLIAATCCIQILSAQDSTHILKKRYKVSLTNSDNLVIKGYLVSLTDSSLNIIRTRKKGHRSASNSLRLTSINYNEIKKVTLRRKGSAVKGLLIGAASGASFGAIKGYISGDDTGGPYCFICFTAAEKANIGAVVFGALGAGIGGAIGEGVHKTFIINGERKNFDSLRSSLIL